MNTFIHSFFLGLLSCVVIGCTQEKPVQKSTTPAAHSAHDGHDHGPNDAHHATEHGVAGAIPGSYEDWCGPHAVPESQCTRCTPALAAAFKATGDWCAEHALPESHCVQCDPTRKMIRPAKGGK